MRYLYWVLTLIVSTLFFQNSFCQEFVNLDPTKKLSQFPLKSWDMDKGMPSDMVVKLSQSNDGYIWLATYKGMSRFDGVRFTSFNHTSSSAIESVTIQDITEDSTGTLWFSSHKGITTYKNHVFLKDTNLNVLSKENVEALYYHKPTNVLWIGTNSKGVYRYNFEKLEAMPQFLNITRSVVKVINSDFEGNIWIGTESGNVVKFSNEKFTEINTPERITEVSSFYPTTSGNIWVTTSNGIYKIQHEKLIKQSQIKVTKTNIVKEDQNHNLWIGSQNGLYRYNLKTGELDSLNEKSGIPNNLIKDILADNEGNLWVATYRKGIFRLIDGLVLNYSQAEGLSSDVITSVTQIGKNSFLIADETGTINLLKDGVISRFKTNIKIPRDRLKHIFFDSNQNLWISTYSGLIKISSDGTEKLYRPSTGFPSITIRLTYEDNQGNIWIGTRSDGLYKLKPDGNLEAFNHNNGLSSNYIMAVTQDKLGRIIVATKNGLNIIESNQIVKHISTEQGLPSSFAFNVHIDNQNVFWLSSNDGILRIENDNKIFIYNIQNGLFDNTLFDILEDDYGFFWIPTDIGIVRMSKDEMNAFAKGEIESYSYMVFDRSDGMRNQRCMGATKSIKATDGRMFFTTNGGVSIIDPKNFSTEETPLKLIIENVVANGKNLPYSEPFIVPPTSMRLQFNFTALHLKSPEKIEFKYRLDPFDEHWVDAGTEREARYTNIRHGTYTFKIMARNPNGTWVEKVEEVKVLIKANWWQTTWFTFLLALLLASAIFGIYKLRTQSIKRQKSELERIVLERTKQIASQKEEIERQSVEMEKLSIVARHTNNAILIASPNGEILWINEAYEHIYGYSLNELIRTKGNNIINLCTLPENKEIIENCIKTHEPTTYTIQVATKYGKDLWIKTTLTPIKNENGIIRNLVAIDTDITELKQVEIEMINMNDEIITQAEALQQQNEEIQTQRDELEQINTLLIRHTENIEASIWYANTIQRAILPSKEILDQFFGNFIVFKPRDIVSGDFYWFTRIPETPELPIRMFVAVVDCTGHGVPGALMSMIGSRLLSEIISERKVHSPSKVLSQLNLSINQVLKQESTDNFDGMDVALCLIEYTNQANFNLTFAGANRPLFYSKKGVKQIETIKGNRKSIGGIMPDLDAEYVDHKLTLNSGDAIFMTTDGFTDQNNFQNTKYTLARMHQTIIENIDEKMEIIGERLDLSFDEFRGTQAQRDDATILGIRFKDLIV